MPTTIPKLVELSTDEVHELIYAIITQDMTRKASAVALLQDKLRALR